MSALLLRWRAQTVLLVVAALVPYDGLLLIAPLPGVVAGWKEGLVFGAFALAWFHRQPHDRLERRPVPMWLAAMGALLAFALFSVALSPSAQSLFGLKIGFFYLLVPVALWWAPFTEQDRDRLVTIMMANGALTSFVGLGQQVVGPVRLNALGYEYNEVIRFAGNILRSFSTFNQPFPFAYFLTTVILLGLPIALAERDRLRNRIFLLLLPVMFIALASTVVRGAILGLLVGGVFLASRHRVLNHALLALPLLAIAALFVDASSFVSLDSMADRGSGWVIEVVDAGVEPLGRGIGSTGAAAERFYYTGEPSAFPDRPLGDRYQPDNYYVKILVELGPIGLWLFGLVIVGALRESSNAERRWSRDQRESSYCVGVRASIIGALAAAIVATYWEIFPSDFVFWLLLGALPSPRMSSSTPSPSAPAAAASRPMDESSSDTSPRPSTVG